MSQQQSNVSILPAADLDKPVIANLIQLYLYDMTGDLPFSVGRNGRFEYDFLERFWQYPYLIFQGDELAGFALVIQGSPVTDTPGRLFMAEFFVLRAYRGKGVGTAAFRLLLRRHPGPWQVGVIDRNVGANAFWAKAIAPYGASKFPHNFDGENWLVYEFEPDA